MIVETDQAVTASTAAVVLHSTSREVSRQTLLIKNTSANGATITVTGVVLGVGGSSGTGPLGGSTDYPLAAGASLTVSGLAYGESVSAKRSGASDATLTVQRIYGR